MSNRAVLKVVAVAGIVALGFVLPFSTLGTVNVALINGLVAVSLVVLTGWVGQISLAQAAFVGIGAFSTALVVRDFGLGFPLTILVGAVAAMVAAALLGVVALRVRGLYLAVATLIFAWMAQAYLFNLPELAGTGGQSLANTAPLGEEGTIPYLDFTDRRTFYFVLLAVAGASVLAMANVRDSKTGRSYFAVKGSEVAAASLGIDVTRAKLSAFALSGFLAGLAGGLLITHRSVASVSEFTVERSLFYLSVAVVGGLTSLGGALASGTLFASLQEVFFRVDALAGFLLLVSASLLAVVLLFFPAGLAGIPVRIADISRRIGLLEFATRFREKYATLRRRGREHDAGDHDPIPARDGPEGTERAGEPRGADVSGASSVPTSEAQGETPGWRQRLARLADRLPERFTRSLVRRFTASSRARRSGPAPDALLVSIMEEQERARAEAEARAQGPGGLVYVPGQASKVRLAARPKRPLVLRASDITVRFGGLTAVDRFDLEVREGEITALIGPNGAGKTTLFNAVSGLNQPTSGRVELYGHDVSALAVHERAALGMGRTFQVLQLFPELTVFDNLMVATHQRNPTGFFSHLAATSMSVAWEIASEERVRQVVELMGLEEEAHRKVAGLPFGRLRLVELARALVTGSPFVMLDEPASGLDNAETDRFMDLLLWVRERLGVTMLLIEHDMRVVMSLADYAYVIDRGKKIAEGTTKRIQRDPKVIAAYLGTAPTEDDTTEDDTQELDTLAEAELVEVSGDGEIGTTGDESGVRERRRLAREAKRTTRAGVRR